MSPPMRAMWAFVATTLVLGSCPREAWSDQTPLVTVDVTGVWEGTLIAVGIGLSREPQEVALVLQRLQGSMLIGEMRNLSAGSVTSEGSTSIQGIVDEKYLGLRGKILVREVFVQTFGAMLEVNGDEMTGVAILFEAIVYHVCLHRQPTGSPPR